MIEQFDKIGIKPKYVDWHYIESTHIFNTLEFSAPDCALSVIGNVASGFHLKDGGKYLTQKPIPFTVDLFVDAMKHRRALDAAVSALMDAVKPTAATETPMPILEAIKTHGAAFQHTLDLLHKKQNGTPVHYPVG